MTANSDPFANHRVPLRTALQAAFDGLEYGYAAPMQTQMAVSVHDEDVLLPGLLCLATAEAVGGDASLAHAPSVALVLLGTMSRVFEGIASEGASELEREWGMPRALNTGDGFYALANTILLSATKEMAAEKSLLAIELLDTACHELSLELNRGVIVPRALLSAGAALGALFAGAADSTINQLKAFWPDLSPVSLQALPPSAQGALTAALAYITNRSRR